MLIAMFGWPVWIVVSGVPRSPLQIVKALFVYVSVVIASGVVGKVAGMAVGRMRQRRSRRHSAQHTAGLV
jgi:hypothetical protein